MPQLARVIRGSVRLDAEAALGGWPPNTAPTSPAWFPKSVDVVLGWRSISETARRKLLWDNAARFFKQT